MANLDEIQANIVQLAEGAGASVVGVGQRWVSAPASSWRRDGS